MYNLAIILHNFVNLTKSSLPWQYLVITLNSFAKSGHRFALLGHSFDNFVYSRHIIYIHITVCIFSVADFEFCAFLCLLSSEARKHVSEASMPPAGARIFKGPVGPLKF